MAFRNRITRLFVFHKNNIIHKGRPTPQPPSVYVEVPRPPQGLHTHPLTNSAVWSESSDRPLTPQEIDTHLDGAHIERGPISLFERILIGLAITIILIVAVVVPFLVIKPTEVFICNPSCANGNCSANNICICSTGWYGLTCSNATCTYACENNGTCSLPNICTCATGWNGTTCSTPICTPSCQNNGTCTAPSVCSCTSSWNDSACQTPVCNPACLNGGNCTAPNNCTCDPNMWSASICQTPVRIFWSFDGTLQDLYNNFNGVGNNGPSYWSPGYNGAGSCLWLNRSISQSVTVTTPPFLDMAYTSFTLETWMYAQSLCNGTTCTDNAVFGQSENRTMDQSLHINVRNQHAYFGFYGDDAPGIQTLNPFIWYHLAYVYDYSLHTQFIYINGYLDVSRSSAGPYKGTTGSLTIGTNAIALPDNCFDGCLDSVAYFARAKSASEVLTDATMVAYLPFDGNTLLDSGPLLINGTGTNYAYTSSGRVNDALTLMGSSSYAQITGLRRLGTTGWPYSVAIWINPNNLAGGTIMHLSSRIDGAQPGAWCLPIMGLTSSGQIAINGWNGGNMPITGQLATLYAWTHVTGTYSPANGQRLYINGTLSGSIGAYNFHAGGEPMTLTLGSSLSGTGVCSTGTIQMGRFYGWLDELYVYARELTASEVVALASP